MSHNSRLRNVNSTCQNANTSRIDLIPPADGRSASVRPKRSYKHSVSQFHDTRAHTHANIVDLKQSKFHLPERVRLDLLVHSNDPVPIGRAATRGSKPGLASPWITGRSNLLHKVTTLVALRQGHMLTNLCMRTRPSHSPDFVQQHSSARSIRQPRGARPQRASPQFIRCLTLYAC